MSENIIFVEQVRDLSNTTLDVLLANISNQANIGANAGNTVTVMANGGSIQLAQELNFVNTGNVLVTGTGNGNVANVSFSTFGVAGNPGGTNNGVQFNNNGTFNSTSNLSYFTANNTITANGGLILNNVNVGSQLTTLLTIANGRAILANGGVIQANSSNLNFINTATVNVAVTANGVLQTNIAFIVNTSAVSAGQSSIIDFSAVATSNQSVFTLSGNVTSASYVLVTLNGLLQVPGSNYTITSNNILTFTSNCTVGDVVDARLFAAGVSAGVIGTPGGANTWIQFNQGGTLGGSSNLVFNYGNNQLILSNGNLLLGSLNVANVLVNSYAQANSGSNTVAISANSAGTLSQHSLNFVNTSSVQVSVTDVGNGNANIAFNNQVIMVVPMSSLNTAITAGKNAAYLRSPKAFILTNVYSSLANASTSGVTTVQIRKNNANVMNTILQIDAGSNTSVGSNVTPVINLTSVAFNDLLQFDVIAPGTNATGLILTLLGNG